MEDPIMPKGPESVDWREVLKFVQEQQKSDREHMKFLLWTAGILAAILAFFGYRSLQSLVESMVRDAFREDQVVLVMRDAARVAAAEQVKGELARLVSNEIDKQRPGIAGALKAEVGSAIQQLQSKVQTAQKQVDGLANAVKERRLSQIQKDQVAAAMKRYRDFHIAVATSQVDAEGKQFGSDIEEAFRLAGWTVHVDGGGPAIMVLGIVGTMAESDFRDSACREVMDRISKLFSGFGHQVQWRSEKSVELSPKQIYLRIGQRAFTPNSGGLVTTIGAISSQ